MRGIAQGGESMDYLFVTCFANYALINLLLGSGTTLTTVTVAYDRRGQAASYDQCMREHDSGAYGLAQDEGTSRTAVPSHGLGVSR